MQKRYVFFQVLFGVFIVLTFNVKAQYKPILTHSKEWLIKTCEFGNCLHDYYYFVADTTINGLCYKVLDGYHYNKNFYLREDVSQRQVFLMINTGSAFLEEYLLYDFGMAVGDSMYVRNPISPVSSIEGYYHLDSIVQEPFEQVFRNVFYLHGRDAQNIYHETKWVEGIGSTGLINTPGVIGDTVAMAELLCVSENVQKIYSRKPNDTCYSNPVLSINKDVKSSQFAFYFAQKSKQIKFENLDSKAELKVYSPGGRLLVQKPVLIGMESFSLECLTSGVYIVSLQCNGVLKSKKIIIQ